MILIHEIDEEHSLLYYILYELLGMIPNFFILFVYWIKISSHSRSFLQILNQKFFLNDMQKQFYSTYFIPITILYNIMSQSTMKHHQNDEEEILQHQQIQESGEEHNKLEQQQDNQLEEYLRTKNQKGVVYMSRIPPYMSAGYVRKLLQGYEVQRIYLLEESEWVRRNRIKHGGSKKMCYREGWIQFNDKRVAKMAALSLNGQKMVGKKGNFYSQDLWNLKYLPKFKWHHLTERLAHEQRLKKERLKLELDQENKIQESYHTKLQKSKKITSIVKKKLLKGKYQSKQSRNINQTHLLQDEQA